MDSLGLVYALIKHFKDTLRLLGGYEFLTLGSPSHRGLHLSVFVVVIYTCLFNTRQDIVRSGRLSSEFFFHAR